MIQLFFFFTYPLLDIETAAHTSVHVCLRSACERSEAAVSGTERSAVSSCHQSSLSGAGGIHLLAWTVSLSGTARSYGALQALSTVISRFTSDFQSRARIVGWEAVIKKPLHGHISYSSLSYVSRC